MCPRIASVDESDVVVDVASQTGYFEKCLSPKLRKNLAKIYSKISHPRHFLLLNAFCIVQTIPALFYYISFFQKGFYVINSSGMAPVWGCTIGAIATAIATGALLPMPSAVSSAFCIAVVFWEFLVSASLFIAAVCLAVLSDYHGFAWSMVGSITTGFAACFLLLLGLHARSRRIVKSVVEKPTQNVVGPTSGPHNFGSDCHFMRFNGESKTSKSDLKVERDIKSRSITNKYFPTDEDSENEKSSAEHGNLGRLVTHCIQVAPKDTAEPLQEEAVPVQEAAEDPKKSRCMKAVKGCSKAAFQLLLWIILLIFSIIPASFGVEQVLEAIEHRKFGAPGTLYLIPSAENSTVSFKMQIHCRGSKGVRPLVILESETGTSGFSLFNLQKVLSLKWRVCVYDRGGYGWSNLPPLGSSTVSANTWRLNRLIQEAEEGHTAEGLILVGHGGGGEMMQAYAHRYPSQVSGLALIDGYPSIERLRGYSTGSMHSQTLKTCSTLHTLRTLESVAVLRAAKSLFFYEEATIDADAYYPLTMLDKYLSTRTNGRYWSARYGDLCVHAGAESAYTDYLSSVISPAPAAFKGNEVSWPSIPSGKPVLIISAGNTIRGDTPDSDLYMRQATLYNQTLSPSDKRPHVSKWIICESCDHSLATDKDSTDVAFDIDQYFSKFYPKGP
jgi:pimeloyl-ACP methyl ester carboxylesterase